MNTKFFRRGEQGRDDGVRDDVEDSGSGETDGMISRACCCPAWPAVQVIMPATPGRPRPTDLLLCGHHYRVSRRALENAGAAVFVLPGCPDDALLCDTIPAPRPAPEPEPASG